MADFDLEALSLGELKKMQKDVAKAISTFEDRHPENPALTWSGRGRKPQWFVEALAAGKTAADLAIG